MNDSTITLRIHGMTCGGCVASVERALRSVDGVADARVNLTTESAAIDIDASGADVARLIDAVRAAGYEAERSRPASDQLTQLDATQTAQLQQQKQALVQAVGLALPIIALEFVGPALQSTEPGAHVWWRVVQALLTTMLIASPAGGPMLVGGIRAVFHGAPNMDTLIAIGVVTAYVTSVVSLFLTGAPAFHFQAAAMILGFINVGKYFETRAKREASSAVSTLARRLPRQAVRLRDEQVETVPIERVRVEDVLRVVEDTVVPVDGVIIEGGAAVDQSVITGESSPVGKRAGDSVIAGGIVREGSITMRATAVGHDSAIGAIIRAVEDAQSGKTKMQRIADRVAGVFVPIVVTIAVLTCIAWVASGHRFSQGLESAIAVLVIACPCAMGLATPTAILVATGTAALRGILVRDAAALEVAARIDVVLLDKTGTLTTGHPTVERVIPLGECDENRLLQFAGSAEQLSQHPLARAIVNEAKQRDIVLLEPQKFMSDPGFGLSATVEGTVVLAGSAAFLRNSDIDLTLAECHIETLTETGHSLVFVAADGEIAGLIALADTIRPSARDAVEALADLGITSAMITGDHKRTAQSVATSIGVDSVVAEVTPEQKLEEVRRYQKECHTVAFVGDGINDAPALAAADVGVAFAAGTDVAAAAADITLIPNDLTLVPHAVATSRRTLRIIKQNLFWAFFYNVAAIPLAATANISPSIAAAAMMASSITVVLNSLRLRGR